MTEIDERAGAALAPMQSTLAADGYRLVVTAADEVALTVAVEATDDACEECLVPKEVFAPMVTTLLEQHGMGDVAVEVRYPVDA